MTSQTYKPFFDENLTPKNKKYSVYVYDNNGKLKLIHFGDIRYQHYKDQIGLYSYLDHNDKKRRNLYRIRHKNDHIEDPSYPGFWSYNFLW